MKDKHSQAYFPVTANPASCNTSNWCPSPNFHQNTPTNGSYNPNYNDCPSHSYLGYCQIGSIQGHTAKRCPSFQLVLMQTSTSHSHARGNKSTSPWQPRAHHAANTSTTPPWLLDSGASHHVTSDLSNQSLHAPYNGSDDIMIGDGTSLPNNPHRFHLSQNFSQYLSIKYVFLI